MIVNLKTAKVLSITLTRRPLLDRAAIEQLTNYDYPDVRLWQIVLQKSFCVTEDNFSGP